MVGFITDIAVNKLVLVCGSLTLLTEFTIVALPRPLELFDVVRWQAQAISVERLSAEVASKQIFAERTTKVTHFFKDKLRLLECVFNSI